MEDTTKRPSPGALPRPLFNFEPVYQRIINRTYHALTTHFVFVTGFAKAKPEHWNQFRGPNGDGDAGNANLPVEFSERKT